jgi:hypothetical protein
VYPSAAITKPPPLPPTTPPYIQGHFPEVPYNPNGGQAQGTYRILPPPGPQLDLFVANTHRGQNRVPEDERQLEALSKRLF